LTSAAMVEEVKEEPEGRSKSSEWRKWKESRKVMRDEVDSVYRVALVGEVGSGEVLRSVLYWSMTRWRKC
jgi:hypothetical protein